MTPAELQDARVTVAGLGKSGLAALELLRAQGARLTATDIRPLEDLALPPGFLDRTEAEFVPQGPEAFLGRDLIVLSPGVPVDLPELAPAREQGVKIIGEVELAGWFLQGPSIGITGSNGKTTTTALTGHILRECGVPAQVGGNIGNPPANMVAASGPRQWNVFELSSFQLETIERFRVDIAAILNVTPDHLDRHHTMEAYAAAKRRILETQRPGDRAILNADDPFCQDFAAVAKAPPVWFSTTVRPAEGFWLDGDTVMFNEHALMGAAEIPLRGRHNVENAMAAAAAARLVEVPLPDIARAIRTFPGVEHRLEFLCSIRGVEWFNDSKATNVDATLKAIDAFEGGLWVILGGKDKGSDYTVLRAPLRAKAHAVFLIGAAASKISDDLAGAVERIECGTIDRAVAEANLRARAGDTVLLAPACASFDQFTSYEHRGKLFKDLVRALPRDAHQEDCTCA